MYKNLTISLFLLFTYSRASIPIIELSDQASILDLTNRVEFYEDSSGVLSIGDITDTSNPQLFTLNKNSSLNFGYTQSAFWIRFKIKGNSFTYPPFVIHQAYANMHYIDFYQFSGDSLIKKVETGLMRPTDSRDFQNNTFAFFMGIPRGQEHIVYMRFKNDASMTIRLSVYNMDSFFSHSQFLNYIWGAFIGILIILMLYNLFIFISLKDLSYLYFSLAIIALTMFFLSYSGTAYVHLWPDKNIWNVYSVVIFSNFIILSFLKFTQTFLLLRRDIPLLDKIINGIFIMTAVNVILLPVLGLFIIIQSSIFITLFTFFIMIIAGIWSLQKGNAPAKYYLLSFGGLFFQGILLIFVRLGILNPGINSDYGFMVTTFLLIILLSQGLASRVNILKKEKEKIDRQFKTSEERFKAIVETTNDFIWETDKDGVYTYVSPNVKPMLGFHPDELLGNTPFDIMPEKEAKLIKEKFTDTLNKKSPIINLVNINKRKNGQLLVLETNGVPFFDANHNLLGYRGVDRDITKRKRAEEALSKSENNLRVLLNATSDISFLTDIRFNIISVNEAFIKILNKQPEEIIGKNAFNFINKGLAKERKKRIDQVLKSGKPMKWEDQSPNGMFENNVYPVFDQKGNITNLAFYIVDISDKKRAEEQIRILSTSVEQSPFSIILFSKKGEITYANPKTIEVTGYNLDEITHKNIRDLQPKLPIDKIIFDALSGKEVKGDYQVQNKNGEYYWESINVFPIKNDSGDITHLIAINEDITARKSLEGQLIQAQKMEAIGTLAGGIAHDFNNLLTIISGYSDLLLNKVTDEKLRHSITNIRYASQKAEDLTRQILTFSKKQVFQPQIIDVNNLLSNLNNIITRLIGEDIKIDLDLCNNVNKIKADPSQYEQIVLNLVVNARDALNHKAQKQNEKQITIKTENILLDETYTNLHVDINPGLYVCLSVIDTGIGMSREIQDQIFEPFFTTKEHSKGTGLGLATVFGIVKQNGGDIYLYSEPNNGSTFKIYWPVTDKDVTYKKARQIDNDTLSGNEKILFVEDNVEILNFAMTSLSEYGYKVISAQNGKQALEQVRKNKNKIDMLITDVIMPDMNGKELSKKIAEILPELKVVFASGYTDDHIVRSGKLTSDVNFIQKPFTVNTLLLKIREVFDKK